MGTSLAPPGWNSATTSATTSSHTPEAIESQTQNPVSNFLYTGKSWASSIPSDPKIQHYLETPRSSLELQTTPTPSSSLASYAPLGPSQIPPLDGTTVHPATTDFLRRFGDSSLGQFTAPEGSLTASLDNASWGLQNMYNSTYSTPSYPEPSPSTATSDIETESPIQHQEESFIWDSFPADTIEHEHLRNELRKIMKAGWKLRHEMEPDENHLLQFTYYDESEGRWSCLFSKEGKLCDCSTRKKDHCKGHIRCHIDHRPFYCGNPW